MTWTDNRSSHRVAGLIDLGEQPGETIGAAVSSQQPLQIGTTVGVGADAHIYSLMRHVVDARHGHLTVTSDLHWGLGAKHPQEQFQHTDAFVKFIGAIAKEKGQNTLVINGDWYDFWRLCGPDASRHTVDGIVSKISEAHAAEVRALVAAVVEDEMRIIYLLGNHDCLFADPQVRQHLIRELGRVAGLDSASQQLFSARIGYSGFAAIVGGNRRVFITHGDIADPGNKSSGPGYPFNGQRQMSDSLGWNLNVFSRSAEAEQKLGRVLDTGRPSLEQTASFISSKMWAPALVRLWGSTFVRNGDNHPQRRARCQADAQAVLYEWSCRLQLDELSPEILPTVRDVLAKLMPKVDFRLRHSSVCLNMARLFLHDARKISAAIVNDPVRLAHCLLSANDVCTSVVLGHTHRPARYSLSPNKTVFSSYSWLSPGRDVEVVRYVVVDGSLWPAGVRGIDLQTGVPRLQPVSLERQEPWLKAGFSKWAAS